MDCISEASYIATILCVAIGCGVFGFYLGKFSE